MSRAQGQVPGRAAYWVGLLRDWVLALIVVIAGFATFQFIAGPSAPSSGPAPAFTLPDPSSGQMVALEDYADQLVVLNFWFTDCGPCRREIPELSTWAEANPDVPLIGISTDSYDGAVVKARAARLGVRYPIAHDRDGRVAGSYKVTLFPTTMVVKNGEIRAARMGTVDGATLDRLVASAR